MKFPSGLFKAELTFEDGSKDICYCEYMGIDECDEYDFYECNGCGKEARRVHAFNIYDDDEHYLGISKTRSVGDWETFYFGTVCVKNHVKVLEKICPSKWT